jgi:hypothetical protein
MPGWAASILPSFQPPLLLLCLGVGFSCVPGPLNRARAWGTWTKDPQVLPAPHTAHTHLLPASFTQDTEGRGLCGQENLGSKGTRRLLGD